MAEPKSNDTPSLETEVRTLVLDVSRLIQTRVMAAVHDEVQKSLAAALVPQAVPQGVLYEPGPTAVVVPVAKLLCSNLGCGEAARSKGLCSKHYQAARRAARAKLAKRKQRQTK